jgi:transcription initiation factor TFIIB
MDFYKYLDNKADECLENKVVIPKTLKYNKCNKCNNLTLIICDGSVMCDKCGIIVSQIINYNDDSRYYGVDDAKFNNDPTRVGIPINPYAPKSSLGTIILGYGNQSFRTLHKWYSTNYKERSLLKAFDNMYEFFTSNNIKLPTNIIDKAKLFYKITSSHTIKRGASRKALMAVSVYYSCKINNYSITKKELAEIFDIKKSKITTSCKDFHDIIFNKNKEYLDKIDLLSSEKLFMYYNEKLHLDNKYIIIALVISKFSEEIGIISDNTPSSIVIGCIYFVLMYYKIGISKKLLSTKCNISEVTISKTYMKLKSNMSYLKPIFENVHKYIDISDNTIYTDVK